MIPDTSVHDAPLRVFTMSEIRTIAHAQLHVQAGWVEISGR